MNPIDSYIAYLKDNPEHYWFKRKLYGWGWTPATKEGWTVLLVWLVLFVAAELTFVHYYQMNPSNVLSAIYLGFVALMVIGLIAICIRRGEKPTWQWGTKRKE